MSDDERASLLPNADTEAASPEPPHQESIPGNNVEVLQLDEQESGIQNQNNRATVYGALEASLMRQNTNNNLGTIQSRFKKRIGKRCKDPKHFNIVPLSTHHGPDDPRSYLSGDYESLDYDVIENDLIIQQESRREYKRLSSVSFNRWFVCFLIGTITACVAAIITIGIERLTEIKLDVVRKYMLKCLNKETCSVLIPWLVWSGFNVAFCTIATVLVAFVEPVAAGSGIPEIKCYLNGVKIPRVVRIKTLVCKAAGIIAAVTGGLACGKEGPMVHSGAVIAAGVSQGRSTTLDCDCKLFKDFRCDHVKRDFIACGAAAGVSAAFGAPIGGVLFALEEGASFWNQSLTWRIFFSSLVSSFALNTILSAYKGSPGDLSNPGLANFGLFEISNYEWFELLIFLLMGSFGGLAGALFNEINIQLSLFRLRYMKDHRVLKVLEVLLVALTTTAAGFCAMYFVEDCIYAQIGDNTTELYNLQMQCDSGKYNSLASLFLQSPESTVKKLLHAPIDDYSWKSLLTFSMIYFMMSVWTYGLAVPSGLFMPNLLTGAAYGRLIGVLLHMLAPGKVSDPGVYALIGAASFLGGVTRMTISLTVIIMEATRNITFGLPIMITLVTARFVGNYFNEGLYDEHINLKQVPMLPWDPPVKSFRLTAGNIKSAPVKCFKAIETVRTIVEMLSNTTHNGFPVVCQVPVDPDVKHFGQFMGLITRDQLILLLNKKAYFNENTMQQFGDVDVNDFRDVYLKTDIKEVAANIPEVHLNMVIDLRQFINLSPYTCNETVSFARIFNLFRSMGLRHLVIVDEDNKAVGMVTRKDLAKYRKWRKQGSSGVQQLGFVGQVAHQFEEDCCHHT